MSEVTLDRCGLTHRAEVAAAHTRLDRHSPTGPEHRPSGPNFYRTNVMLCTGDRAELSNLPLSLRVIVGTPGGLPDRPGLVVRSGLQPRSLHRDGVGWHRAVSESARHA